MTNLAYQLLNKSRSYRVLLKASNRLLDGPVRVLYGHRVIEEDDFAYPLLRRLGYVNTREFRDVVTFIVNNFSVVSLEELVEGINRKCLPSNAVAVTFDDGYSCFYRRVFPLLMEYGIPATVFISTGFMNDQQILWFDRIVAATYGTQEKKAWIRQLGKEFNIRTLEEKAEFVLKTARIYKDKEETEEAECVVNEILDGLGAKYVRGDAGRLMLDWEEVKQMAKSGLVAIGSHGVLHRILSRHSEDVVALEVCQSKKEIEKEIRQECRFFSYPNAGFDHTVKKTVKEAGFELAFITKQDPVTLKSDPYSLGRYGIEKESIGAFAARMVGLNDLKRKKWSFVRYGNRWLPGYIDSRSRYYLAQAMRGKGRKRVFICICDHFEPLWQGASNETGFERLRAWIERYPAISKRFRDSDGMCPKYTFFYPMDEYRKEHLDLLYELCKGGYGEVEMHYHHDNDTAEKLRKALLVFKEIMAYKHGLLSKDENGQIRYGFIHGDWALDNSRDDSRFCGVNNEIQILQETGCYADFTMPSYPCETQARKVNSIYYAVDDPSKPRSMDYGQNVARGTMNDEGLLMVQGPLLLDFKNGKFIIIPYVDSGCLRPSSVALTSRVRSWIRAGVSVKGGEECTFIKLYTHGCQDRNLEYLLGGGLGELFCTFERFCGNMDGVTFHYVSARELYNIVKSMEAVRFREYSKQHRDRYVRKQY